MENIYKLKNIYIVYMFYKKNKDWLDWILSSQGFLTLIALFILIFLVYEYIVCRKYDLTDYIDLHVSSDASDIILD